MLSEAKQVSGAGLKPAQWPTVEQEMSSPDRPAAWSQNEVERVADGEKPLGPLIQNGNSYAAG